MNRSHTVVICGLFSMLGCEKPPFDAAFAAAARIDNVKSLAIARDGALVREQYFGGAGPDTPNDVRSVTKSAVALAVGAALDEGCLRSLDQTLGEVLGPLAPADPAKAAIRVRDLLTMSSGLAWDEVGGAGYDQWASAPDQVAYVLSRDLVASPGSTFNYDSGAFHLLSVALSLQCAPTAAFVRDHLLQPLGIQSRDWENDNQGYTNGAAGLQLTTREMLALGGLILDAGRAGSGPAVPAAYVEAATQVQMATGSDPAAVASGYGYGWWIGTTSTGASFAMAEGYGGQFIVVIPSSSAVVAATARWQGLGADAAAAQFWQVLDVLDRLVLPSL